MILTFILRGIGGINANFGETHMCQDILCATADVLNLKPNEETVTSAEIHRCKGQYILLSGGNLKGTIAPCV